MKIEDSMKMYFERKVENVHIEIDVEEAVKNKLSFSVKKKYNTKIIAFLTVLLITGITHTAIVYGQNIFEIIEKLNPRTKVEFSNEEGETEWSAYIDPEIKGREAFEDKVDIIWEELDKEEKKWYLIGVKDEKGNARYVIRGYGIQAETVELINEYALEYSKLSMPKSLLGRFEFNKGEIKYDYVGSYDHNEIIRELEEGDSEFLVKEFEGADMPGLFAYSYYNANRTEEVNISINTLKGIEDKTTYLVDTESNGESNAYEKIMVNGLEVLYGENSFGKAVSWVQDGTFIGVRTGSLGTKEDVLNMVKEIVDYNKSK